ncbi:uncharacterized protein LOC143228079 [Tachypleus tridentatus]|uniref:uncharacterized protein LOC143228079 n=1 Tax=Tachypleus tridentatus TaxID=6853 RepID=UPI003FD3E7C9
MLWKMMARSLHFYSYGLRYTVGHSLAFFVYFVLSQMLLSVLSEESTIFTNCGGTLHDPKGVIFTPNFPHAYPIPISCKWKIEAPGNQMIAIYFTQFYMREGLRATEYAYFEDESHYMGKTDLGLVSFDSHVNHLVTNKTILVLEFTVLEPGNIHLRVIDLFLDVYGFNITYEMISKNDYHLDPCINNHCTFNGNCLASADFSSYQCQCLQEFYGDECQFSPKCGPGAESAICYNEGTCRHYIGSRFRMCNCPPGYQGTRCEKRVDEDPFISKEYFDEGTKVQFELNVQKTS